MGLDRSIAAAASDAPSPREWVAVADVAGLRRIADDAAHGLLQLQLRDALLLGSLHVTGALHILLAHLVQDALPNRYGIGVDLCGIK